LYVEPWAGLKALKTRGVIWTAVISAEDPTFAVTYFDLSNSQTGAQNDRKQSIWARFFQLGEQLSISHPYDSERAGFAPQLRKHHSQECLELHLKDVLKFKT
jgi:hypothetical protein